MNKYISILIVVFLILTGSSGCAGKQAASSNSARGSASAPAAAPAAAQEFGGNSYEMQSGVSLDNAEMAMNSKSFNTETAVSPESPGAEEAAANSQPEQHKIIVTGNLQLEATPDAFGTATEQIRAVADAYGGYIESSNLNINFQNNRDYRFFNITLKIPNQNYKMVWEYVQTLASVRSASETQENVTRQYYDISGRLKTKRVEEERVLELLSKAEKIEDILSLEQMLGEIRLDIETYESQIRNIDRLTAYSTIFISLNEVEKITEIRTPTNIGEKISQSFAKSVTYTLNFFESVILFLALIFVPLVVLFILAIIGITIYRLTNVRKNNKE